MSNSKKIKTSKKSSHSIKIIINFEKPIKLKQPIAFERSFSNCKPDRITVHEKTIEILYERKSNTGKAAAINKTRIKYIQEILLALSCLDENGHSPQLESATYSKDDGQASIFELPKTLTELSCHYSGRMYGFRTIERCLQNDTVGKSLRIAISYNWAAFHAFSSEERFKLLWGSFNALYREFAKINGLKSRQDAKMIDEVVTLFNNKHVLNQALDVFKNEVDPYPYKSFVKWKILTGDKSKALYIKRDEDSGTLKVKKARLQTLDKDTLIYMRDCGCEDYDSKQNFKAAIEEAIIVSKENSSSLRKTCMLLCRYTYIFRCDGVHANIEYPVFGDDDQPKKEILGNLLEAAIIDFADWLSKNYPLETTPQTTPQNQTSTV